MLKELSKIEAKTDPDIYCFLCSKPDIYFNFESIKYISTLTLCSFHTDQTNRLINPPIKVIEREPGEEG